MIKYIRDFFGYDKVIETGVKIVDKLAGTDFTEKERAEWLLSYIEKTKHQSPVRRTIAIIFVAEQITLAFTWLVAKVIHRTFDSDGMGLLAQDIQSFLASDINTIVLGIVGFYFVINLRK